MLGWTAAWSLTHCPLLYFSSSHTTCHNLSLSDFEPRFTCCNNFVLVLKMALLLFFLTFVGMFNVVLPNRLATNKAIYAKIRFPLTFSLTLSSIQRKSLVVNTSRGLKRYVRNLFTQVAHLGFLDLPLEVRNGIYEWVCFPEADGSIPGVLNILLLNRQIHQEAKPLFDRIPHRIVIGDMSLPFEDADIWGRPRRIETEWHSSIRRLVIVLSIYRIGKMTPDTFDLDLSRNGKVQWRALKKLVGVWPEVRQEPLEQIRIELHQSKLGSSVSASEVYTADVIRILRNFKRTSVWAETGNCNGENQSLLLPLARAFNQARRNWVEQADFENNLLITYDAQHLNLNCGDDESRKRWKIEPINDTSRTDNHDYPPLTEEEERYIDSKMIRNPPTAGVVCEKCLAYFDRKKEFRQHLSRGHDR